MISESRDSVGEIPSRKITRAIVRKIELNNKNIYMYYKLGKACVTNWGSFVITNWGKCCYKLGQLLQIRATVITKYSTYYKLGQNLLQIGGVLQIRAIITNWGIQILVEFSLICIFHHAWVKFFNLWCSHS